MGVFSLFFLLQWHKTALYSSHHYVVSLPVPRFENPNPASRTNKELKILK